MKIALLCCLGVLAAFAASANAAAATKSCPPPKYPGTGYFTALSVKGTTCTTGRKFVVAYYKCRIKHGAAGRCTSKVMGYACTEKRNTIPTEIDARVTCRHDSATITHVYQQDL
jgi:hypothetical protein